MSRAKPRKQKDLPQPKPLAKPSWVMHGRRGLAILLVALAAGVAVGIYAFRGGLSSPAGTTHPSAPYQVSTNPSNLQVTGPGIVSFDVNVSSPTGYSNPVYLRLSFDTPSWVKAVFQPSTVIPSSLTLSRVVLVVGGAMSPGSLSLRIEAVSLSYKAVTILNAGITAPNSGTAFYLYANQTGFNDTSTSTPNPTLTVHVGETFGIRLYVSTTPNDIHHYVGIYPGGTQLAQVKEQGVGSYAHSSMIHTYPQSTAITFTSYVPGMLEYYCDSHPNSMHGKIPVVS